MFCLFVQIQAAEEVQETQNCQNHQDAMHQQVPLLIRKDQKKVDQEGQNNQTKTCLNLPGPNVPAKGVALTSPRNPGVRNPRTLRMDHQDHLEHQGEDNHQSQIQLLNVDRYQKAITLTMNVLKLQA